MLDDDADLEGEAAACRSDAVRCLLLPAALAGVLAIELASPLLLLLLSVSSILLPLGSGGKRSLSLMFTCNTAGLQDGYSYTLSDVCFLQAHARAL